MNVNRVMYTFACLGSHHRCSAEMMDTGATTNVATCLKFIWNIETRGKTRQLKPVYSTKMDNISSTPTTEKILPFLKLPGAIFWPGSTPFILQVHV